MSETANPSVGRDGPVRIGVLLALISIPTARRHPGRLVAITLSIALGVAAITASGSLIRSSLASIRSAWQVTVDRADLRVSNGFAGVPDELLEVVRDVEGIEMASALFIGNAHIRGDSGYDLQIVALDLFSDDPIHRGGVGADELEIPDEMVFLTRLDAVVLERSFADARQLGIGDTLDADLRTGRRSLHVAGLLNSSPATAAFGSAVAIMDLPAAQVLLGRQGLVDAIDVRVVSGASLDQVHAKLEEATSGRANVARGDRGSEEFESLVSNLRLILGVPGVMAIVVGALVIHHAVAAVVSRRKPQLDIVRSLGATRRSLFKLFATEGLVVGAVGTVLGILLGLIATHVAVDLVRETLGALYRPLPVSQIEISLGYLAIGVALGLGITLLAFLAPARSAIGLLTGLSVVSVSRERWRNALRRAGAGLCLIPIGLMLSWLQSCGAKGERLAAVATTGDALVLFGVGLLVPVFVLGVAPRSSTRIPAPRTVLVRLAWQGVTSDPARTAMVVTAVLIGAAYMMITVGPIGSLRHNIVDWLDRSQTADLVIAGSGSIGFFPNAVALPPQIGHQLEKVLGVSQVEPTGLVTQPYGERWLVLVARRPETLGSRYPFETMSGDIGAGQTAMRRGEGGIVSRHFALQHDNQVGDTLRLRSPTGPVSYRIEAIVTDYSSADLGTVFVTPELLRDRWRETGVSTYHVWLDAGADTASVRRAIATATAPHCACSVLTRDELRDRVTGVVDSMFYMAYALEVIAGLVMIVAVLSFFSISLDERAGQIALLQTLGATRNQVVGSLLWEAVWIGLLGGVLGCAIGIPLAMRMTQTTMRLGGGFEFTFVLAPEMVALTIGAAMLICTVAVLVQLTAGGSLRKIYAGAEGVERR